MEKLIWNKISFKFFNIYKFIFLGQTNNKFPWEIVSLISHTLVNILDWLLVDCRWFFRLFSSDSWQVFTRGNRKNYFVVTLAQVPFIHHFRISHYRVLHILHILRDLPRKFMKCLPWNKFSNHFNWFMHQFYCVCHLQIWFLTLQSILVVVWFLVVVVHSLTF